MGTLASLPCCLKLFVGWWRGNISQIQASVDPGLLCGCVHRTLVMGWGQSPLHQDNVAVQTFILLHIFLEPKCLIPVPTSCTDR